MARDNFNFLESKEHRLYDLFHKAEALLAAFPANTVLNLRRGNELLIGKLVAAKASSSPAPKPGSGFVDFSDRMTVVAREELMPDNLREMSNRIQKVGSEAAHPGDHPKSDDTFRQEAKSLLPGAYEIARWFGEALHGDDAASDAEYELPPPKLSPEDLARARLFKAQSDLEEATELADARRALDKAAEQVSALRKLTAGRGFTKGWPAWRKAWLNIELDSLAQAIRNHRGETDNPPTLIDLQKIWGDAEAHDQTEINAAICLHATRVAVFHSNAFRFEEAIKTCDPYIGWREDKARKSDALFGDRERQDRSLGILYGTRGQAYCFYGHHWDDRGQVKLGLKDFDAATAQFKDAGDKARQKTYRAHALLELLRLPSSDAPLSTEEKEELEAIVDGAAKAAERVLATEVLGGDNHGLLFVIDVALKAVDILRLDTPKWLPQFASQLAKELDDSKPLPHPVEHVAGRSMLLLKENAPKKLRAALESTAAQRDPGARLLASIATAFLLEAEFRAEGIVSEERQGALIDALPKPALEAWEQFELGDRLKSLCQAGGAGPLRVMPFNYA